VVCVGICPTLLLVNKLYISYPALLNAKHFWGLICSHLHERTAPGSHQAEHRERVYDEAQLLVRQERVDEDEARGGQQQQPHPPVKQAEGEEQQRAAQAAGHGGVEVPEEGSGVPGRRESRRTAGWRSIPS